MEESWTCSHLFSTNYNLSFIWHFIGHVYLCLFPLISLSLSHYSLVLMEFLHFGGNSKLLLWKLETQTSKEETRSQKSSPMRSPKEPKVLFPDACLEFFLGCQNKNRVTDYEHISASSAHGATTDHGDRIRLKPKNAWKAVLVPVFGTKAIDMYLYSTMKKWNYNDKWQNSSVD